MEPITVNGRQYIKMNGVWYCILDAEQDKQFISGLEDICNIHGLIEPFINFP